MNATKVTGTEKVIVSLRERILEGQFQAGAPLREEELSTYYGVSRHVMREVLRKLASEGLAEYSSFRGVRIPLLAAEDVADIYVARQLLECGSLVSGASKLDVQKMASIHAEFATAVSTEDWNRAFESDMNFHSYIVGASGSHRLASWHRGLMLSLKVAHLSVPDFQSRGMQRSVPQHGDVVLALAASDIKGASLALERHLKDSECILLQGLSGAECSAASVPTQDEPLSTPEVV